MFCELCFVFKCMCSGNIIYLRCLINCCEWEFLSNSMCGLVYNVQYYLIFIIIIIISLLDISNDLRHIKLYLFNFCCTCCKSIQSGVWGTYIVSLLDKYSLYCITNP